MRSNRWLLASVAGIGIVSPALSKTIEVKTGSVQSEQQSLSGTDSLAVDSGASLSVDDTAIKLNSASTDVEINNSGIIESTLAEGRAINAGGSDGLQHGLTIDNAQGGIIRSQDDAIRINVDFSAGSVRLVNAGTIVSSVDGQAIDFDAATSTSAGQIEIDNLAGGVIQSTDADAIRPGQGAVINNAGLVYAGKVTNKSSDGIDFQDHSGTVHNLAGGVISGARHGITSSSDVSVVNDAGGMIIGRNGSGVGSDGNGTIVNYGTITGAYDGSGTGDGDGIDIDGYGQVENFGAINALGAAGYHDDGVRPNYSDGISIGSGGTVTNHAGASIYSVDYGVVVNGAATVINAGNITAQYGVFFKAILVIYCIIAAPSVVFFMV